MTESAVRTFLITLVVGLLLMFARSAWLDGLGESWSLGGPGTRTALDVEVARDWIAMTNSFVVPHRMDKQ